MMRKLFADRRRPLYEQAAPLELGPLSAGSLAEAIGLRFEESDRDAGTALGHPGGVRVADPLFAAWLRGLESR